MNPDDLVCLLLPPPPPSKMLLDYIKDTKNNDALKEKLCVRLENVHDAREWQNLVFCLTSLQYRYKSGTLGVGRQYRSIVLGGGGALEGRSLRTCDYMARYLQACCPLTVACLHVSPQREGPAARDGVIQTLQAHTGHQAGLRGLPGRYKCVCVWIVRACLRVCMCVHASMCACMLVLGESRLDD